MNKTCKHPVTLLIHTVLALCIATLSSITVAEEGAATVNISGTVTDVRDAGGYTYAEVDTGQEKIWAAGPRTPLQVGDKVNFTTGMAMYDFHSKAMDRDFSMIYFIGSFNSGREATGSAQDVMSAHGQMEQHRETESYDGIKKLEGGNTIAEIHAGKGELIGSKVRVRGKVIKYNAQIMGKNWLHIRDRSTQEDLTVTTNHSAEVGDIVILEGTLGVDRDYGYGYVYPVLLEDASITKE